MKPTDFSKLLTDYLTSYLPSLKNVSKNTISSYCDTFRLLLKYCRDVHNLSIEKISMKDIDAELVSQFMMWLEEERHCSISTRNQRLMAIRSFFRYVQGELPQNLLNCQKVLNIPPKKKNLPVVTYLTVEEMKLLLAQPNTSTPEGIRDLVLLCILYDTGGRVQEIADLTVRNIRLENPAKVQLTGKGRKTREVPLLPKTVQLLQRYMIEHRLLAPDKQDNPLFCNRHNSKLTRSGIAYILNKYVQQASSQLSTFHESVSPHVLRHTKAMHLLQAGVNIIYIRDILGHASVDTTQVYASANTQMKRAALEKLGDSPAPEIPSWAKNTDLLTWLKDFGKGK